MPFRSFALIVLAALPLQALATPAPVPMSQYPEVYALVYVGKGSNDKKMAQRIAKETREILNICHPMYKDKGQFHIKPLEKTGVLRVWYTEGTPKEQADIINRMLSAYDPREASQMRAYEYQLQILKSRREDILKSTPPDARLLDKVDEDIRLAEERLKTLPRILEWAATDGGD